MRFMTQSALCLLLLPVAHLSALTPLQRGLMSLRWGGFRLGCGRGCGRRAWLSRRPSGRCASCAGSLPSARVRAATRLPSVNVMVTVPA